MTHLGSNHAAAGVVGGFCGGPDSESLCTGLAMIAAVLERIESASEDAAQSPQYLDATHLPRVVSSPLRACLAGKRR